MKTTFATLALAATLTVGAAHAADPSGKLVVYTSQLPEVAQQTVDAFKARHPAVEVEWVRNGTGQLMNILQAEIAAGQVKPDVLLVADDINLGQMKRDGRLQAYEAAPVAGLDTKFYDKAKTFFGTKIIATGIAWNTMGAKKPTGWADLLAPDAKGKIAMPSAFYSGAALVHLHTLVAAPGLGWDFFKRLAANAVVPEGGNGPALKAVAGGQKLYGIITDGDVIRAKAAGSPVDFVYPAEGASFITEPVAILATAKNVPAARAFVDFLLSKEGQELVAKQGNLPISKDVAPPAGFQRLDTIKLIGLDADKAVATDAEVKKTFATTFGIAN